VDLPGRHAPARLVVPARGRPWHATLLSRQRRQPQPPPRGGSLLAGTPEPAGPHLRLSGIWTERGQPERGGLLQGRGRRLPLANEDAARPAGGLVDLWGIARRRRGRGSGVAPASPCPRTG